MVYKSHFHRKGIENKKEYEFGYLIIFDLFICIFFFLLPLESGFLEIEELGHEIFYLAH